MERLTLIEATTKAAAIAEDYTKKYHKFLTPMIHKTLGDTIIAYVYYCNTTDKEIIFDFLPVANMDGTFHIEVLLYKGCIEGYISSLQDLEYFLINNL